MRNCLFAWTDVDPSYPPYVNLTQEDDGRLVLRVRSPGFWKDTKDRPMFRMVGNEGAAALPLVEVRLLRDALNKFLGE